MRAWEQLTYMLKELKGALERWNLWINMQKKNIDGVGVGTKENITVEDQVIRARNKFKSLGSIIIKEDNNKNET